jgi:WD40 repeat protein
LWAPDGSPRGELAGHTEPAQAAAFLPDGSALATATYSQDAVKLWDVATREARWTYQSPKGRAVAVAVAPDGKRLAAAGSYMPIQLLAIEDGKPLSSLEVGFEIVLDVAFSPDGRRLAAAAGKRAVVVYDLETSKEEQRLELGAEALMVTYSRDGKLLAAGGIGEAVQLWNAADGTPLRELKGQRGSVARLAFSPDGRYLLAGCEPGLGIVWEVASGEAVLRLRTPDDGFRAGFVSVGKGLAFNYDGGFAVVPWDLSWLDTGPDQLLERAEHEAGAHIDGFNIVRGP